MNIKNILFLFATLTSINAFGEEPFFMEVNGIPSENIQYKDGVLIINNANVNVRNINKPVLYIKKSNLVKSIKINNFRVNSHNANINKRNSAAAIIFIETGRHTKLQTRNMNINSYNAKIKSTMKNKSTCAALYCKSSKGKVKGNITKVTARGDHVFTAIIK